MTVTIQIGNSDDKLTQKEWAAFVMEVQDVVQRFAVHVHFSGSSSTVAPWQNCCWILDVSEPEAESLRCRLVGIRRAFRQDSVAWTVGETQFI